MEVKTKTTKEDVEKVRSWLLREFRSINRKAWEDGEIDLYVPESGAQKCNHIYERMFGIIEKAKEEGVISEKEYRRYKFEFDFLLVERFTILKDYISNVDEKDLLSSENENGYEKLLSYIKNNMYWGTITDAQGLYLMFFTLFRAHSAALKENPHGGFLTVSPQARLLYELYTKTNEICEDLSKVDSSKNREWLEETGVDTRRFKELSVVLGLQLLSCPYEEIENVSKVNTICLFSDITHFDIVMDWHFQIGNALKELLTESETGEIHFEVNNLKMANVPGQGIFLQETGEPLYSLTLTYEDYRQVFKKAYSVAMEKAKKEFMDRNYEESAHALMYAMDAAAELKDVSMLSEALSWVHDYTPEVVNKVLFIYANADEAFKKDIRKERIIEKAMVRFADNYMSTHKIDVFEIRLSGKTRISTSLDKLVSNMIDEYKIQVSDEDAAYLEEVKKRVIDHIHNKLST